MSRQLVFFDKHKKLQGPHSERKIQEWYRAGWFDREFRFSFLAQSEQHNDKTPAYSLNELISCHGHSAPFGGPPSAEFGRKKCDAEERLARLEKQIADARSTVGSISTLTQRLEKAEQQLKMLTVTPPLSTSPPSPSPASPPTPIRTTAEPTLKKIVETPPTSTSSPPPTAPATPTTASTPASTKSVSPTTPSLITDVSKRAREECEELASRVAPSTLHAMDLLQSGETTKWDEKRAKKLLDRVDAFLYVHAGEEAVLKLAETLVIGQLMTKFVGKDYVFCGPCSILAFNPRQALVHLFTPDHADTLERLGLDSFLNVVAALVRIAPSIYRWGEEEHELDESQRAAADATTMAKVVPSHAFLLRLQLQSCVPISLEAIKTSGTFVPDVFQQLPFAFRMLKGELGAKVIADLDAHIGNGMTGCVDCGVVTRTREAYYEHILGWKHMVGSIEGFSLNVVAIAVNCQMAHLVKTPI